MPFRLSTSCMNARQVSGASLIAVTTLRTVVILPENPTA
jgi:hypothetical protein